MSGQTARRFLRSVLGTLALLSSLLLAASQIAHAEDRPTPTGEPLEELAANAPYRGLAIVGANGEHPVEKPRKLRLSFNTLTEYGGEQPVEYPVLGWKSSCNGHSYKVEATPTRLNLYDEVSTRKLCVESVQEEERWLESFFRASPQWQLSSGRLILTTGGNRIVLHHPPSDSEKEAR